VTLWDICCRSGQKKFWIPPIKDAVPGTIRVEPVSYSKLVSYATVGQLKITKQFI